MRNENIFLVFLDVWIMNLMAFGNKTQLVGPMTKTCDNSIAMTCGILFSLSFFFFSLSSSCFFFFSLSNFFSSSSFFISLSSSRLFLQLLLISIFFFFAYFFSQLHLVSFFQDLWGFFFFFFFVWVCQVLSMGLFALVFVGLFGLIWYFNGDFKLLIWSMGMEFGLEMWLWGLDFWDVVVMRTSIDMLWDPTNNIGIIAQES